MRFGANSGKRVNKCGNNLEKVLKISVKKLDFFYKIVEKRGKTFKMYRKIPHTVEIESIDRWG